MAELAKKLGIEPGHRVCLLDPDPAVADLIRAASPQGVSFSLELGQVKHDLILFWPRSLEGMPERFSELQTRIVPNGAIWAVMPKKKYARKAGVDFTWEQMQAAGLQTDLVDNKIASVSDEEYGTRFVIRKDRRPEHADPDQDR